MRLLLFIFILLLAAISVGYLVHQDSGYVLVSYNHWSLETSLWVAIILIVLIFMMVYLLIRLVVNLSELGSRWHHWKSVRKNIKAQCLTHRGLCQLAEGHWQQAENTLAKAARFNKSPLINYLSAARAAQAQQAYDRRDAYLRIAHLKNKEAEVAIGLTQAQLQLDSQQYEQALATLKHLTQLVPNHNYVLKLLCNVYIELKDWKALQLLLPDIRKQGIFKTLQLSELEEKLYSTLLSQTIKTSTIDDVRLVWRSIPRSWQFNSIIANLYVSYLINHNQQEEALHIIEYHLKKEWDSNLVLSYAKIESAQSTKQLKQAEHWLTKHPEDAALLYTLGKLSMQEQIWGKARQYFEASIRINPKQSYVYFSLGQVLELLGENNAALDYYRKGLTVKY